MPLPYQVAGDRRREQEDDEADRKDLHQRLLLRVKRSSYGPG
jgi:hypothetical protein